MAQKQKQSSGNTAHSKNSQYARQAEVLNRSLWQSYSALPARTRRVYSLSLFAFGVSGILVSNYLEKRIPAVKEPDISHP